jgi:hypothetical protein
MKLLRGIRREVTHGGIVPRGWQMAWYEPRRRTGVYYPRPLNLLLRVLREFVYRCARRASSARRCLTWSACIVSASASRRSMPAATWAGGANVFARASSGGGGDRLRAWSV